VVQIVKGNHESVGIGFPFYAFHGQVFIEAGRGRPGERSFYPHRFEETFPQEHKVIGVLLGELSQDVIFNGLQIRVDLTLKFVLNFRVLFQIAHHVGRSDPHCLSTSQEQANDFVNNLLLIILEHFIPEHDRHHIRSFLCQACLLVSDQLAKTVPLACDVALVPSIVTRETDPVQFFEQEVRELFEPPKQVFPQAVNMIAQFFLNDRAIFTLIGEKSFIHAWAQSNGNDDLGLHFHGEGRQVDLAFFFIDF